jgi:Kae1-associated kinase Bud32
MQILKRGAEAILYLDKLFGETVLVKERIKKSYRLEKIDLLLRKFRTRKEVKLLTEARKIGVPTPKVLDVDEKTGKIVMEFIDGILIKDFLDKAKRDEIEKICEKIGELIGKLHSFGIVHGDPTTSNMILKNEKIYFIDFGLGEFSNRIEDKAVDLRLLHDSINATHPKILEVCWRNIMNGYRKEYKNAENVFIRLEEIRKRARYVKKDL